jgi:hypothetical protein
MQYAIKFFSVTDSSERAKVVSKMVKAEKMKRSHYYSSRVLADIADKYFEINYRESVN